VVVSKSDQNLAKMFSHSMFNAIMIFYVQILAEIFRS
jgi:hypothetical protein